VQRWFWSLPFVFLGWTSRCIYTITATKCGSTHCLFKLPNPSTFSNRDMIGYPFLIISRPFISRYIIFADVTPTRRQQFSSNSGRNSQSTFRIIQYLHGYAVGRGRVCGLLRITQTRMRRRQGTTPQCTRVATITFRCVCHIVKSDYYIRHVCLPFCRSVCPNGITRVSLDGLAWNLIFEWLSKICRGN
jgi:hypothetical protein